MVADEMGMAATKLRPPAPPARVVQRPRLHHSLDDAIRDRVPLVLVSAPAGAGKSTLVAAWAAAQALPVAWLQVEDSDTDPASFWTYLVAAIGRVLPDVAGAVRPSVLGSMGDDRAVVPTMVNALVHHAGPMVLVIDDYHLIDSPDVHRGIERLLDLSPEGLTVVLCTRMDPPFRLGRMRVRQRLREVRANDLRFAAQEAASLLGAVGGELRADRLDDLCARTEGWAAGLVLAGLSMEQSTDPDEFVHAFRGDDQLVVSYLNDELLASMGAGDRLRLLETSVLGHLCGPLVDAVTASTGGSRWLIDLAAHNQLVIRLDSTGDWFRYHHLLHDLLALEARRAFPDRIPELHDRAAGWFVEQHDHAHAVTHLLEAGRPDAALALMRYVGPDLLGVGQVRTLRTLLRRIGPDAEHDAVGALLWGWCEYLAGRTSAARQWHERCLAAASAEFDPIVAMPLHLNLALGGGDVASAIGAAEQVMAESGSLDERPAELATAVGSAYMWAGRTAEAEAVLSLAVRRAMAEQRITAHVMALVALAINEAERGDPSRARAAAGHAIATAEGFGLAAYHGVAPAYAVRARFGADPDDTRADLALATGLARTAATDLGRAYALTLCGDTLLDLGDPAGQALLADARRALDRCVDPGVASRALGRAESRHRLVAADPHLLSGEADQLTERELAVLRFLPTALSQRDIAAELFVSLNTVKTHCSAIFRKLQVGDRKSAVQAARDRHLL